MESKAEIETLSTTRELLFSQKIYPVEIQKIIQYNYIFAFYDFE